MAFKVSSQCFFFLKKTQVGKRWWCSEHLNYHLSFNPYLEESSSQNGFCTC